MGYCSALRLCESFEKCVCVKSDMVANIDSLVG
jgi:hypothetical protein